MGCSPSNNQSLRGKQRHDIMELSNGRKIPTVGYGTWMAKSEELEIALDAALEAGYRHIDTAAAYENEDVIGRVLKRWFNSGKLKREDIFVTTKLPPTGNRPSDVQTFLDKSLKELQLDYVDLYLVHVPFSFQGGGALQPKDENGCILLDKTTDHIAVWKAMEAQVDSGKAKAIGISNFNQEQIQRVIKNARIPPANLQIEIHVFLQQQNLVKFCKENNITVTAYSPLGSPGSRKILGKDESPEMSVLTNAVLTEFATKYKKSTAQIALRFLVQRGIIIIPKSIKPNRIKENIDIFDFELTEDEMNRIRSLDQGEAGRIVTFTFFKGINEHPEYPF